jgi:hypothetical protein
MHQRQLRLGDVLDDYCPRERRVTNHVIVAMVGDDVKQTRCTTCDADHEYKGAKVPRVRRKTEAPAALAAQGFAAPKLHDPAQKSAPEEPPATIAAAGQPETPQDDGVEPGGAEPEPDQGEPVGGADEGPVHRRLIRASLPRVEGQAPPSRPNPEFTIRQPNNTRQNRFRPRHGRGGGSPQVNGNRSFGGGYPQRQHGGGNHQGRRRGRSK